MNRALPMTMAVARWFMEAGIGREYYIGCAPKAGERTESLCDDNDNSP